MLFMKTLFVLLGVLFCVDFCRAEGSPTYGFLDKTFFCVDIFNGVIAITPLYNPNRGKRDKILLKDLRVNRSTLKH
ncbi:MAG: Unknown protein [uncultured Sulfurovum sp.]|uniref:Uncharacterized protein n=1 Tax=uncultured Sulfurovum sp. TaxID=269237 RepID=A0A6S6S3E7_9BACT|nr:MAG: Unknown protein [uncultured Sulfurovum sp.]